MKKVVFLIPNIEEYGKLISYCVDNDISVFRLYWDDREKGDRCYHIDWVQKRCFYATRSFYEKEGFVVLIPSFVLDRFGCYKLIKNSGKEPDKNIIKTKE